MNQIKVIVSPFKSMSGDFHHMFVQSENGQTLAEALQDWDFEKLHVVVNGRYLKNATTYKIQKHDDIIVSGIIGWSIVIAAIVAIIISVVLSIAFTLLFPVKPPKFEPPEKDGASFSWQGIRTSQGPGSVVPICYGRHRVGGQLLSSYVEERVNSGNFTIKDPTLHMLIAVSEGEIEEIEFITLEVNDQPIANFNDIVLNHRLGTAGQAPLPFFQQVKNTFDAGNIDFSELSTIYTTTEEVNGFIAHVDFALGLYSVDTTNGSRIENKASWRYRYRVLGSGPGGWSAFETITTVSDQRKNVHVPIKVEELALNRYDIEVDFIEAEHTHDQAEYRPFLSKVSEIVDVTESFPNTALYGLRIVATENLQGSLPNVTVIIKGLKVRVGSFASALTYTDNPSWCVMDFLTNSRYGLGIPDSEIDLASFIAFANYCDELVDVDTDNDGIVDFQEKRCVMSYHLDTDSDAPQVIDEMLIGTRSALVKTEGLWKIKTAQDSDPVQLITWAATKRDSVILTYLKDSDDVNVLEARFSNEEEDYEQDVLTYPRVDDWPETINKSSLEFRSFSRPSQVERETAFNLVSRQFQKQILEFEMNVSGIVFEIMDVIRFSHPLPGYGYSGRVAAQYGPQTNTTRVIILDADVPFTFGLEYHVFIQNEDGEQNERIIENPTIAPGTILTRVLTLEATEDDLTFTPSTGLTQWAFGAIAPEQAIKEFRITRIERTGDFFVNITAVEHNPTIFDPFNASLLPSPSHLLRPDGPPPPLIQLVSFQESLVQVDGSLRESIGLEWDVMLLEEANELGNQKYSPYGGAYIYRRYVAGSAIAGQLTAGTFEAGTVGGQSITDLSGYNLVGSVAGQQSFQYRELAAPLGTTLEYQVVPVSIRGVPNNEGALRTSIVVGQPTLTLPVDPFTTVTMEFDTHTASWRVTVTPPTNIDKTKIKTLYIYRNLTGMFKPHPELQFGERFGSIEESGSSGSYAPQFNTTVLDFYNPDTDAIGTTHYFWFWYGMVDGRTSPPFPDISLKPGTLVQTVPSFS